MIPFASQRGNGQDLATHLMNSHDNETVQIAHIRGAVAGDLHGAFAEWEAQAAALTRCRNYLYSLSVNPDPSHGTLSRERYLAYIDQVEEQLGLSGQPRAVVFHVKEGREHCHVIWSRIDVRAGKARHLAYDHDKLMMVTRQFARDHGITLPEGYFTNEPGRQLSLYEKAQQDQTGLSLDERKAVVTDLWRRSDSAAAFVSALAENGYVLATGKRPYVLVDIYGHVNALPKLIDDRTVRTKGIRAFFGHAYSPESLPSVEEAQALAAQHRQALEDFEKARIASDRRDELKQRQAHRRANLEKRIAALRARHRRQTQTLNDRHRGERKVVRTAYKTEVRQIELERARRRPKGLAAFLSRVSGVALIRRKVQRYRDRKRYESYRSSLAELRDRQETQRSALARSHDLQTVERQRRLRALTQIEQRERQSLETALLKERRKCMNGRHTHMPPLRKALRHHAWQTAMEDSGQGSGDTRAPLDIPDAVLEERDWYIGWLGEEFNAEAALEADDSGGGRDDDGPKTRPNTRPTTKPKRTRRPRSSSKPRDKRGKKDLAKDGPFS